MRTIRNEVFETNSSSVHSLVVRGRKTTSTLDAFNADHSFRLFDETGCLIVEMGQYGWGGKDLASQYEKMQYLLTMVMGTELRDGDYKYRHSYRSNKKTPSQLLKATKGFRQLSAWVETYNGKGLSESYEWDEMTWAESSNPDNNGYKYYIQKDSFIDHQSCSDDYCSLADFLASNEKTLDTIILNPRLRIHLDNDNH